MKTQSEKISKEIENATDMKRELALGNIVKHILTGKYGYVVEKAVVNGLQVISVNTVDGCSIKMANRQEFRLCTSIPDSALEKVEPSPRYSRPAVKIEHSGEGINGESILHLLEN